MTTQFPTLKIAHVTTVHRRMDPRIYEKEAAAALEAFPGQVALFCADGKGDAFVNGLYIRDMGRLAKSRPVRILKGNFSVVRTCWVAKPELVHFHDPELIPAGLILRACGFIVIYDVHEDMKLQIKSKRWLPRWLRPLVGIAVRWVELVSSFLFTAIIAATPRIAKNFRSKTVITVRNYPILNKEESFKSFKKEDPPAFGYVGGISEVRGIHAMFDALAIVNASHKCTLHLAGKLLDAHLKDEILQYTATGTAVWHGLVSREEVNQILSNLCCGFVVLMPLENYLESLPTKMFEYMAAGLPVIASDFPVWREIIDDAGCGILVDPQDPNAIADAMSFVINNPNDSAQMGIRGKRAVAEKYSWDSEKKCLIEGYQTWLA